MDGNQEKTLREAEGASRIVTLLGLDKKLAFWEGLSITAFMIGAITIMTFALPADAGWWNRSALMFSIALGAWMSGSALGFLFGVPKYKSAPEAQPTNTASVIQDVIAFTPNTNLEQISDWLTKIIIGATLVQANSIIGALVDFCKWIGDQTKSPETGTFCGGIVIFFFFSGFLWGYLWCSIRIFREMVGLTARLKSSE